jgi:hypothetical protein
MTKCTPPGTSLKLTLKTVKFGGKTYKITSIGTKAFKTSRSKGITKITVGKYTKTVGASAFYKAPALKSLVIGSKVTKVGSKAVYGAKKLKALKIGKSVKAVGAKAFVGTKVKTVKLYSSKLTKNACKSLVKGTKIKTVKLYGKAKDKKAKYKKWFAAYGVTVK